jgi:hypothetical protein
VSLFVTMALQYNLNSFTVIPSVLLFLLRAIFYILGLLFLHMNFRIDFSISVENDLGLLIPIALNL